MVSHAGGDPVGNDHTGAGPMRALMERHPAATAVIAHMGAPEYADFLSVTEDYDRVHLDTTMAFTDFRHQLESLGALGPGDDWLRKVCWDNGATLFGPLRQE